MPTNPNTVNVLRESITVVLKYVPVVPTENDLGEGEPEEDCVVFLPLAGQLEDGGSGGEYRPLVHQPEDPGGVGYDRAPRFEPDENPTGGGSYMPACPQEPLEDDRAPRFEPDEPPLGGGTDLPISGNEDQGDGSYLPAVAGVLCQLKCIPRFDPDTAGGGGNDLWSGFCALGDDGFMPDEDATRGGRQYLSRFSDLVEIPVFPEELDGKGGKVRACFGVSSGQPTLGPENDDEPGEHHPTFDPEEVDDEVGSCRFLVLSVFPVEKGGTGEGDEEECSPRSLQAVGQRRPQLGDDSTTGDEWERAPGCLRGVAA